MLKPCCIQILVVLGAIWMTSMSLAMGGKDAAEGTGPPTGRDVLVSGAGAIATGKSPAIITLDLAANDENKQAQLELSISPVTVATNEAYIIVVTQVDGETAGEAGTELGSFSFFPPPRQGEVRRFLVDVPPISPEMKAAGKKLAKVSVRLVSVDPAKALLSSSVSVVGARIVTG